MVSSWYIEGLIVYQWVLFKPFIWLNVEFQFKCGFFWSNVDFFFVKCGIFGQKNQFLFSRIQIRPDDYSSTLIQRLFNDLLRKMRSAQKISTHKSLVVKLVKVRFGGHDAKKRIPFFRPYSGIYAVHSVANVYAVLSFYNVKMPIPLPLPLQYLIFMV